MKRIRPMRILQDRAPHPLPTEQSGEAVEGLVEPGWIAQWSFEKLELLLSRPRRFCFEADGDDWIFGAKIFQMRLENPEQELHRIGWLRDLKTMLVSGFV